LQKYYPCLLEDPRTILKTTRAVHMEVLSGEGGYHHIGVKRTLSTSVRMKCQLQMPLGVKQFLLQINTDRLHVLKSSSFSFGPF